MDEKFTPGPHQIRYECERLIERARLGYLLATGQLDAQDANDIIYECQPIAGWFPLETVDVDGVIELAAEYWEDHPAIPDLAAQACRRVWNKWSSTGDAASAAQDWAVDLIGEYAEADGIMLKKLEETA